MVSFRARSREVVSSQGIARLEHQKAPRKALGFVVQFGLIVHFTRFFSMQFFHACDEVAGVGLVCLPASSEAWFSRPIGVDLGHCGKHLG